MSRPTAQMSYTERARWFVARFPVLNHVSKQVSFWVLAFSLLVFLMHFSNNAMAHSLGIPIRFLLLPNLLLALVSGIIYGIPLGLADHFFDKEIFRDKPLGKLILIKSLLSLVLLLLVFLLIRYVLFDLIILTAAGQPDLPMNNAVWNDFLVMLLVYSLVMTVLINFINEVNKKFGPGVLVPLLLGRYRNPKEEERVFLFMDLKSSTTIAEALGHIKYSAFIRDSFTDINRILNQHDAEVYQYVGDEIVISWRIRPGHNTTACVEFFFAAQQQFESRRQYYIEKYGHLPLFKAGLHLGKVTAVEIGEMKRDIAYHGDTLNTAARIQSMCNHYDKRLLASAGFINACELDEHFRTEEIGEIILKGKTKAVIIMSIEAA